MLYDGLYCRLWYSINDVIYIDIYIGCCTNCSILYDEGIKRMIKSFFKNKINIIIITLVYIYIILSIENRVNLCQYNIYICIGIYVAMLIIPILVLILAVGFAKVLSGYEG